MLCALWLALAAPAQAADMNGAWAIDVTACDNIFARNGDRIRFRSGAHRYGNAFILENDRIRGRIATCKIKGRQSQDGEFTAACSGNVIDTANFTLKVIDNQQLSRAVSGRSAPEIFHRCWP
jgi:hypothetical protein